MSVKNTIEVTLAANTSAFSTKLKEASNAVRDIGKDFKGLGDKVDGIEGRLGTFGDKVTGASQRFNGLSNQMSSFASSLKVATDSLRALGEKTIQAGEGASGLAAGHQQVVEVIRLETGAVKELIAQELLRQREATSKIREEQNIRQSASRQRKADSKAAADAEETQYEQLARAQQAYRAKQIADAKEYFAFLNGENAKQITTANEVFALTNRQIAAEEKLRARQGLAKAKQDHRDETAWIRNYWAEQDRLSREYDALESGRVSYRAQQEKDAQQAFAEENKRIAQQQMSAVEREKAERLAAERAVLEEKKRQAQEAKDAHRQQVENYRVQMDMLKGMAQLWSAAKIKQGLVSSVDTAADGSMVRQRVSALNMSKRDEASFYAGAENIRNEVPVISSIDAVKVQLAGLTGKGKYDKEILDSIMPTVAKMTTNIASLFGEANHKVEDSARNLFGLFEAMGATGNLQKMKDIADTVQRGIIASGGKLTVVDMETEARRVGMGNAPLRSVDSLLTTMAFMGQMKAMGGSGGSSGGSSTTGVMERQLIAAADGGFLGKNGGKTKDRLIDLGWLDAKQAATGEFAWKNNDKAHENIFAYSAKMAREGMEKIANDKTLWAKYSKGMGDLDPKNIEDQMKVYARVIGGMTYAANNKQTLLVAGSAPVQERLRDEEEMGRNSKGVDELAKAIKEEHITRVKEFTGALNDLGATVGNVILPVINPLISWITKFIEAANEFGKENPIAATLTTVAVAATGVAAAISGFGKMFGITMKVLGVSTVEGAAVAAGGLGILGGAATMVSGIVAKAFTRMIPLVGTLLLAWDLTNVIANLEVGGHQIKEWAANLMDWLLTKMANGWEHIKDVMTLGINHAEHEANVATNNKGHKDAANANGFQTEYDRANWRKEQDDAYANVTPGSIAANKAAIERESKKLADARAKAAKEDARPAPSAAAPQAAGGKVGSTLDQSISEFVQNAAKLRRLAQLKLQLANDPDITKAESFETQAQTTVIGAALEGRFDKDREFGSIISKAREMYEVEATNAETTAAAYEKFSTKVLHIAKLRKATEDEAARLMADDKARKSGILGQILGRMFGSDRGDDNPAEVNGVTVDGNAASIIKSVDGMLGRQGDTSKFKGIKDSPEDVKWLAAGQAIGNSTDKALKASKADGARDELDNITSESERAARQFEATTASQVRIFSDLEAQANYFYEAELAHARKTYEEEAIAAEGSAEKILKARDAMLNRVALAEGIYLTGQKARQQEIADIEARRAKTAEIALASPVKRLGIEWEQTTDSMRNNTANWARGFMDQMVVATTGGKANWRQFVVGMATDLQRTMLQKTFGGMITKTFEGLGDGLSKLMSGGSTGGTFLGGLGSMFTGIVEKGKGLIGSFGEMGKASDQTTSSIWDSVAAWVKDLFTVTTKTTAETTATAALTSLAAAANAAATALGGTAAGGGGGSSAGGALGGILGALGGMFGGGGSAGGDISQGNYDALMGMDTSSIGDAAAATDLAGTSFIAKGGSFFGHSFDIAPFANGGAFTNNVFSDPTLFKFANGGKFGVMGEAGPEAVMPLSRDKSGRLGVTVNGNTEESNAGGEGVVISIVVHNTGTGGSETQTDNGKDRAGYKEMANKIKAIVIEQITTQQRPGGVLYKG